MGEADTIRSEGEAALRRIASGCRASIDDVLDIMAILPRREKAGACLFCFFNLYRKLPPRFLEDLDRVRVWLEREIEVVATDDRENLVEAFPCRISESELEQYCRRVMAETKDLVKPGMEKLILQFRFCEPAMGAV